MILPEVVSDLHTGVRIAAVALGAAGIGLAVQALGFRLAARVGERAPGLRVFDGALLRRVQPPMRVLVPLLAVRGALPLLDRQLDADGQGDVRTALQIACVGAIAWLLIALTYVLDDVVAQRFDIHVADNLRARRVRTQIGLLRRVLAIAVGLLAVGIVLMRFDDFHALGTSLLASAGFIGIFVSIAAQRPLSNIVAGIQLALTQPIRVDDAVVVEGEWGLVEEITLTYVVVRIWDQRRLVLPINHFFEHPFQNWTRASTQVVGTVFVSVDYTAPIAAIREAYERIVHASPLWDGAVCGLQVTDATERTIQLRGTMSASNAGRIWDLRCEVREHLVEYLQQAHPDALPRVRLADRLRADGPRSAERAVSAP